MSNIINDIVYQYITRFAGPRSEDLADLRRYAAEHRVPIILPDAERLLMQLLQLKQPKRILEVGTAIGYSAACFARVCPNCRITTIEADERAFAIARSNLEKLGVADRVSVYLGEGQTVIPELPEEESFDFVFIDAAKSHYRVFWDEAVKRCREGAVIVCDNVLMKAMTASDTFDPGRRYKTSIRKMREFLDYITDLEEADTAVLPVGDGLSVSIWHGKKENQK